MAKEHERLSRQVAGYHRVVLGSTCGQVQAQTASSVSAKGSSTPRIVCWSLPSVCSGATAWAQGMGRVCGVLSGYLPGTLVGGNDVHRGLVSWYPADQRLAVSPERHGEPRHVGSACSVAALAQDNYTLLVLVLMLSDTCPPLQHVDGPPLSERTWAWSKTHAPGTQRPARGGQCDSDAVQRRRKAGEDRVSSHALGGCHPRLLGIVWARERGRRRIASLPGKDRGFRGGVSLSCWSCRNPFLSANFFSGMQVDMIQQTFGMHVDATQRG